MSSRAVTPHTFFGILAQGLATWDNPPFVASAGLPKERERHASKALHCQALALPKKDNDKLRNVAFSGGGDGVG